MVHLLILLALVAVDAQANDLAAEVKRFGGQYTLKGCTEGYADQTLELNYFETYDKDGRPCQALAFHGQSVLIKDFGTDRDFYTSTHDDWGCSFHKDVVKFRPGYLEVFDAERFFFGCLIITKRRTLKQVFELNSDGTLSLFEERKSHEPKSTARCTYTRQ